MMLRVLLIATLVAATLSSQAVEAEEFGRPPIHVQIVLDSSGSMLANDPAELSKLAGMIFTDLIGPDDQIGVLSMQKNRFVTRKIGRAKTERGKVRSSIKNLPFSGATFCADPLVSAAKGLKGVATPGAKQFVIFLSDGACPRNHTQGADEIRDAAKSLKAASVRVFSIGLFGPSKATDSAIDLKTMAEITDGEYFPIQHAKQLPETFAKILGRIVGSDAQKIDFQPGPSTITLDGYAYDASIILTSQKKLAAIRTATAPNGSSITLPTKAPHSNSTNDHFVSLHSNGAGTYYNVVRLEKPSSGEWGLNTVGPSAFSGILIQNYALNPRLIVPDSVTLGETQNLQALLAGENGKPILDKSFLKKVIFEIRATTPAGKNEVVTASENDRGMVAEYAFKEEGTYQFTTRVTMKEGGLNKRSNPAKVSVVGVTLVVDPNAAIDLGTVKAGSTTSEFAVDFSKSSLPKVAQIETELQRIPGVDLTRESAELAPDSPIYNAIFEIEAGHPGGAIDGHLVVKYGATTVKIPVSGTVTPLSFWEQYGKLIMTIGFGLLFLILIVFIVYGFISPHSFGSDARLNWGESTRRLAKNEIVIREIPGTGKGFYKNATLTIGGASSFLPVDGVELVTLEASGANQITITAVENVELLSVNKFDDAKTKPVDGNSCFMNAGELYRVGSLYLRLQ